MRWKIRTGHGRRVRDFTKRIRLGKTQADVLE